MMTKPMKLLACVALCVPFVACADQEDPTKVVSDREDPGIQLGTGVNRGCAVVEPSDERKAEVEAEVAAYMAAHSDVAYLATSSTVNVHYHIITSSSGQGAPTAKQLSDQIAVLNAAYAASS